MIRLVLGPMSFDSGARPPRSNRRLVLLLSALAAIVLAGVGGVALFSGNSWRDEAMSSGVFPSLPGSEFSNTATDEPWWTSSDAPSSSAATASRAATATIVPATATATATAASDPSASAVPTSTAPAPSTTQAPPAPPSTGTPSPSSTHGPKPKPHPKPSSSTPPAPPSPTPSPTSSDPGCWLIIIC